MLNVRDLPEDLHRPRARAAWTIADRERDVVEAMVERWGGDRERAAAALGMSVSTLKRRLRGRTRPRVICHSRAHE